MRKSTASFFMMAITVMTAAALWTWPVERWETVKTVRVSLGSVERTVSVTGVAARKDEYYSAHPKGGVVVQVYVQEGQPVAEGQPIYRLDDAQYQAALKQAMQALENADAAQKSIRAQAAAAFGQDAQTLAEESLSAYGSARAELVSSVETLTAEIEGLTQRAYRDGQVLQLMAREGELLLPGSPGAVLSSVEAEVRAEVIARDSRQIKEGMRARITQNGMPLGEAVVEKVGLLKPNSQGVSYAHVVLAPLDGLSVPVGTQIEVDIILEERAQVPVVPVEALTDQDTIFQVYEGRAWERSTPVLMWDSAWAAVDDLQLGTEVVLSPDKDLYDGVRLKVVKP
jgi:multidrug efflux pump subunit AcrA (membrane-fusion protein)